MRRRSLRQTIVLFGLLTAAVGSVAVMEAARIGSASADGAANQPPAADAGQDRTVAVNIPVVLDGSRSTDIDGDRITFAWQLLTAPPGSLAALADADAVKPGFTPDLAGDYVFGLTVDDGVAASPVDTVRIGTDNSAPVADAGRDRAIGLGETVVLDAGGSSDVDGDLLSYSWALVSAPAGSAASIDFPGAVRPGFFVDIAGDYVAELTVSDGSITGAADQILLSVGNLPPVPEAGPATTVAIGGTVRFDPDGTSDADEDLLTARWTLIARPAGSLAGLSAAPGNRPSLTPDLPGTYLVQIRTDDGSARTLDTVAVSTVNSPPVASAGPDRPIVAGQVVQLDGAGSSDVDGDLLGFRWALVSMPAGSTAALDDALSARPEFTADVAGLYVAQLIVDDGTEPSLPDTVVLSSDNTSPVADAGLDQTALQDSAILLDGSNSSDADLDPITYRWAVASVEGGPHDDDDDGGGVMLSDPTAVTPTLTFGGGGDDDEGDDDTGMGYAVVQLLVSDGITISDADTVVISTGNSRPVANAGLDFEVLSLGGLAQLDGGFSSDADSDALTYHWSLIARPADSLATLSGTAIVNPSFTVDKAGLYVAQLIVNDGMLDSRPDTVAVLLANLPPVADAGADRDVFVGQTAALDGTGSSDPDLDPLSYAWTLTSVPTGSATVLSGETTATPSFVPDRNGAYVAELVVNDGIGNSPPDTVTLTTVNRAPVADAGADQSVTQGATVALDGSASTDPDNDFLTFAWTLTARPSGSAAMLADGTSNAPSLTADAVGFYTIELIVNDGAFDSPIDAVVVNAGVPANTPPVLGAVGNQMVALGATLPLALTATDGEGDPLSFFAAPTPLPEGASLDAATGAFSFRPDADQVGDVVLTFGVSDGRASDSETVTITVTGAAPGGITALTGRLLDAVAAEAGQDLPIVGATLSFANVAIATTDGTGAFTLSGLNAGQQILTVNGFTASAPPDGTSYTNLRTEVTLVASITNELPNPIFMPRQNLSAGTLYDPADPAPTLVTNPNLQVTLELAPGSVTRGGPPYSGRIELIDIPPGQLLPALPPMVSPCEVTMIRPFGMGFNPRAQITLPNHDNLPPSTVVDIWKLNPSTGFFFIESEGVVSANGTQIVSVQGLSSASTVFAMPRPPSVVAAADQNGENRRPTTLADGNLFSSISLPSYRSLDKDRTQTFVYNSTAAAPTPIVAAEITFHADGGLPPLVSGRLEVGGITAAGPVFTSTSDPVPLVPGETIRQALQFPGRNLPTGSYPFRYVTTSNYACSKVGAATDGQVLVTNESESPFGAGWTLAGLQRLHPNGAGVTLTDGTGSQISFARQFDEGQLFRSGAIIDLLDRPGAFAVDDLDRDGNLDLAVPDGLKGTLAVFFGDGQGDFPTVREYTVGLPYGVAAAGIGPDPISVATGNFNNDNLGDIAVINQYTNNVVLFRGTAGRNFAQLPSLAPAGTPTAVGVSDFDGDGNDDVFLSMAFINSARLFLGRGDGSFDPYRSVPVGDRQLGLTVADMNGDAAPDIVIPVTLTNRAKVLQNNGSGVFTVANSLDAGPFGRFPNRWPVATADFNGDGFGDIASVNVDVNTVSVLLSNGPGTFLPRTAYPVAGGPASVDVGDFNGDGAVDIAVSSQFTGTVTVLSGDGFGGLTVNPSIPVSNSVLRNLRTGDFDGDGLTDIAAAKRLGSPPGKISILLAIPQDTVAFETPVGEFSSLQRNADGTYTRTNLDGGKTLFNESGQMTAFVDRNGNSTTYSYNAAGTLESVTDPAGGTRSYTYGSNGLVSTMIDPAGRLTAFTYDDSGNLVAATDVDDSVREMAYDANGRLVSELSKRGFATSHSYGAAGQWTGSGFPDGASVTAQISRSLGLADLGIGLGTEGNPAPYAVPNGSANLTDANGNPYTMRFNRFGSVIEVTDPIMRTTVLTRNDDDLVIAVEAPSDGELPDGSKPGTVTTQLDYDDRGNVILQREAAGTTLERETRFTYEPVFNQVTRIIDPSNTLADPPCATATVPSPGVTCFEYDAAGNQTRTIDGLGGTQIITYDARGLRTGATDPNGNLTEFFYDLTTFNLDRVILASGDLDSQTETRLSRDGFGNVTQTVEGFGTPEARTTSATFDDRNRVLTETDGAGVVTTRRYDSAGNETETEDATDIVTTRTFDERNRLLVETNPAAGPIARSYDSNGNLESITNALNNTATLVYDAVNRVERFTDPLLKDRLFGYDAGDNLVSVTDARQAALPDGKATIFAFDPLGRKIRRTDQLGAIWSFAYDSRNNLTRTDDAEGQAIVRDYDALSRLETMTTFEALGAQEDVVALTYDAVGNRLSAVDADSALDFTYDGLNRVLTTSTLDALAYPGAVQPAVTLTSIYNPVGNRRELTHGPNAVTIDGTWTYSHDGAGQLASLVHPTGDLLNPVALAYDPAGRLSRIDFPNAVATDLTYDAEGRPASIVHAQAPTELARFDYGFFADGLVRSIAEPGGARVFSYDATQQLTGGGTAAALESYDYDDEGNRTSSHLSASHLHDAANRLVRDESHCYDYDANGNLISKTELAAGACAGPMTTYSWDVRNRLVRIDFPNLTFAAYRYDALDRRIGKDAGGAVTHYVYDDDDILLEFDGANTLQARYGHGIEVDQPLVMERGGQSHFYHADHLGSIRLVTDGAGLAVNGYDYDAFGNFEPSTVAPITNPYAFTAREYDPESGLNYYRARYYDSLTGRFIGEDPIACRSNDLNLYRYVFNSPTNLIDPRGEAAASEYLALLLGIGVGVGIAISGYIEFDPENPFPDYGGTPITSTPPSFDQRPMPTPPPPDCEVIISLCFTACDLRIGFVRVACMLRCTAIAAVCIGDSIDDLDL